MNCVDKGSYVKEATFIKVLALEWQRQGEVVFSRKKNSVAQRGPILWSPAGAYST